MLIRFADNFSSGARISPRHLAVSAPFRPSGSSALRSLSTTQIGMDRTNAIVKTASGTAKRTLMSQLSHIREQASPSTGVTYNLSIIDRFDSTNSR